MVAGAILRLFVLRHIMAYGGAQNSVQDTTEDVALLNAYPDCFHHGYKWAPDIPGSQITVDSLSKCQAHCAGEVDGCAHFAYWPTTGACYSGGFTSNLVPSSEGAIAGRAICRQPGEIAPACKSSETPLNGFPGFNATYSNRAWPSGRQPWSLECWPMNWTGGIIPCSMMKVLDDSRDDWPGKCRGLTLKTSISAARCPEDCIENPLCASYQIDDLKNCWQGTGKECFVRKDFVPLAAQRILHGKVTVLMDLVGWQVIGLARIFINDPTHFLKDSGAIRMCKTSCYSDIRCQYWQYSPKYGCWVEDVSQGFSPIYPLTLDGAFRSTPFALDCVAGEMIQHSCPIDQTTVYPTSVPTALTSSCMKTGVRFTPNLIMSVRTIEMGPTSCQARCSRTKKCKYFAYWPDGSCDLQGRTAIPVTAEDRNVISGTGDCAATKAEDGIGFGGVAEQSLNPGKTNQVSTSTVPSFMRSVTPAPPLQVPAQAAVSQSTSDAHYMAEVRFLLKGLDYNKLSDALRQNLEDKYVGIIANNLNVPPSSILDDPNGEKGSLWMHAWAPESTMLTVFTQNQPANSNHVGRIRHLVLTTQFSDSIVQATTAVLGTDVSGISDQLQVTSQKVSAIASDSIFAEMGGAMHGSYSWLFVTGLVAIFGTIGFYMTTSRKRSKDSGRKQARSSAVSKSPTRRDSQSSGEDLLDDKVWASEPSWPSRNGQGISNGMQRSYQAPPQKFYPR